jgi:diguanylate cyclase (GGDEF)-like protein
LAFAASLTILALKLLGLYSRPGWTALIMLFSTDVLYLAVATYLNRRLLVGEQLNRKILSVGKVYVATALAVKYNFMLYLVPSRDIWYVSLFFLWFTVLFLDFRLTAAVVAALTVSNVISIFVLGGALLPPRDDFFYMLLATQLVTMLLLYGFCLVSIYLLSKFLVTIVDSKLSAVLAELEKTENSANRDMLTGLFNRRYANLFFSSLYDDREGDRYCIALLDLDDFKLVNDSYGHPCGDQVLVAVGEFVRGSLRKSDYVFRWGGEEFLILLQGADLPAARVILEKLCKGLGDMVIETREATIRMTATIGVAELDAADVAAGIKACDEMLYHGKASGKNQVVAELAIAKGA